MTYIYKQYEHSHNYKIKIKKNEKGHLTGMVTQMLRRLPFVSTAKKAVYS